ncbi:hypothetical protein D3C87_1938530 [compost metagenome]
MKGRVCQPAAGFRLTYQTKRYSASFTPLALSTNRAESPGLMIKLAGSVWIKGSRSITFKTGSVVVNDLAEPPAWAMSTRKL